MTFNFSLYSFVCERDLFGFILLGLFLRLFAFLFTFFRLFLALFMCGKSF